MADAGTNYTDAAMRQMERRFRAIYRETQADIIEKLNAHTQALYAKDAAKRAQVAAGTLSQQDYQNWLNGQVFIGKQWKDKVDSVATSLLYANQQANDIVEGKKRAVFGENATFQAYSLEHGAGMDLSFGIYDSATVTRLIREEPELLPRKVVNGKKDKAWNQKQIANAVTQGVIQGESIPQIAQRIAKQTSSQNMDAMTRYARTAMTGAQNAGRMEMLHEAQDMGIVVKKKWLATLDSRTRDAHANLDGQVQNVDDPFKSDLGDIMYPGDFSARPANTWNCRCSMTYVYPEYPERKSSRRAYAEYIDDNGDYHRESYESQNMTYNVWKLVKDKNNQKALDQWRARNGVSVQSAVAVQLQNAKATTISETLQSAYDYHTNHNNLRRVSAVEMTGNSMNPFEKELKIDEQGRIVLGESIAKQCADFDTPLTTIRTMTPQEALGNTAFASTRHNYETGTAEIIINPLKCGDTEKMVGRMRELRDKGYIPRIIPDEKMPEYVYTHEFGHTLLQMQDNLTNSRNWVGENYSAIRSARREIESIYSDYISTVSRLETERKNEELEYIINLDANAGERARQILREEDKIIVSKYSLTNSDEFIAECYAYARLGGTENVYAQKVMETLIKFFGR